MQLIDTSAKRSALDDQPACSARRWRKQPQRRLPRHGPQRLDGRAPGGRRPLDERRDGFCGDEASAANDPARQLTASQQAIDHVPGHLAHELPSLGDGVQHAIVHSGYLTVKTRGIGGGLGGMNS